MLFMSLACVLLSAACAQSERATPVAPPEFKSAAVVFPAPDRPVATLPTNPDSWTMGDADADADVLDAYLESRRRAS